MRIRVDLLIDKPLRRGGHVVSRDGERFWVHFRYERLPTFCYLCRKQGHDDKHCQVFANWQNTPKQYGEWLKVNGSFKRELQSKKISLVAVTMLGMKEKQIKKT